MLDSLAASCPSRTGRFSPPKIPPGCTISATDVEYLRVRGISEATAKAAGWYTATKPSHVPDAFARRQRQRVPALIAPHLSPTGAVGYQKRDHHPGRDRRGRLMKWVSPKDSTPVLAVHPWTAGAVLSGSGPVWAVEGITRMLALAELGIPAVSYAGCYTWQKGGEPLDDWRAVNLSRLVYDVPDADARTNSQVQEMQAARVPYFETRGARVLAVSVPEVNGDEHAGLDDYIGAGGGLDELAGEAAPFEPSDVGLERLERDEALRHFVASKLREVGELPARKAAECNARKVARWLTAERTPSHGKRRAGGFEVRASYPEIAEGVRLGSYQTVSKALDFLDGAGFLKMQRAPRGGRSGSTYVLLDPSGGGSRLSVKIEGRGVEGKESLKRRGEDETPHQQRESHTSLHSAYIPTENAQPVPALRNSKLVHTFVWRGGKRVVVDSHFFKRYGAKREEIIRYVFERGCVQTPELHELFGAQTSRLRGFYDTHLKIIVDDGVFRGDLQSVEVSPAWREALEGVRGRTDEPEDNRLQSEKYARRRAAFRLRLEAERRGDVVKPESTPDLAGPERAREIFDAAKERDHAARIEAQRSKVGTTPETFLLDALDGVSGFGWRELGDLWRGQGGKREDLARVVRDPATPWTFQRENGDGPLYVERRGVGSDGRLQKTRGAEGVSLGARTNAGNLSKPETGNLIKPNIEAPQNLRKPITAEAPEPPENLTQIDTPRLTNTDTARAPKLLTKPNVEDPPEDLTKPHFEDLSDVFRNTPRRKARMLTDANPDKGLSVGLRGAPKGRSKAAGGAGGVYVHGAECDCWICGDDETSEAAAEPVEIGASA